MKKSLKIFKENDDNLEVGFKVPYWFWGAERESMAPQDTKDKATTPADLDIEKNPKAETKNPDAQILELIAQNPEINVNTFYNLLKSKGFQIVPPTTKEADASSGFAQALRSEVHESKGQKKNGNIDFKCRFLESAQTDSGVGFTKYRVVIIQEGMGNLKDAFYYDKQALISAIPIFEGKKIYADHPSTFEENVRPERSVRDVLGHFENVKIEENEKGQAILTADVVTLPDEPYRWARALMTHAVEYSQKYPDKEFIGLSINASGDANAIKIDALLENEALPAGAKPKLLKAKAEGVEVVKLVTKIDSAVSCDLVTEAGAGGMILEFIEGAKNMKKKINLRENDETEESKKKMKQDEAAKMKQDEAEESKKKMKQDEAEENDEAKKKMKQDDEAADIAHDDEKQDIELIKKILADYGITDAEDEEIAMGQEALEAAHAMGLEGDEAQKCAGYALKMAKHMSKKTSEAKKMKQDEAEAEENDEAKKMMHAEENDEAKHKQADECKKENDEAKHKQNEEKKKESSQLIKLAAENAALKEANLKYELEVFKDTICFNHFRSRQPSDAFKNLKVVKEAKSKRDVEIAFDVFKEHYTSKKGEFFESLGLFVQPEKKDFKESSKKLDLKSCLK